MKIEMQIFAQLNRTIDVIQMPSIYYQKFTIILFAIGLITFKSYLYVVVSLLNAFRLLQYFVPSLEPLKRLYHRPAMMAMLSVDIIGNCCLEILI